MPASLISIIIGCLIEYFLFRGPLNQATMTIKEKSNFDESQAVPRPFFLNSIYDLRKISNVHSILMQSVTIALVAMLESLMTLEVMNDLTQTVGQPNQQIWALGAANILAGIFGTMGGNSLIELSVMSVQAGGVLRASAVFVALGVLAIVLFASPVLNLLPCGTLAGIMVIVVMDTAKWSSFPAMAAAFLPSSFLEQRNIMDDSQGCGSQLQDWLRGLRIQKYDAFVIISVTCITAVSNLAIAVFCGIFFASVRFAWEAHKPLEIQVDSNSTTPDTKTYIIKGNLFFATKEKLATTFNPDADPQVVEIDFLHATIFDFSILHAFHPILQRYSSLGKQVHIYNLREATHIHNLLRFSTVRNGGTRDAKDRAQLSFMSDASRPAPTLARSLVQDA